MTARIAIHPVTPERWPDVERLFETKGCPHFCWCTVYRLPDASSLGKAEKKETMRSLVASDVPVGMLAYAADEPVGWCSIAPRPTYGRLERSRTMPLVEKDAATTWAVLCFFVKRSHRGAGVSLDLLRRGVEHAKIQGAKAVEGYPWDTMGISSTHRGHSGLFKAAGFKQDGKRWVKRFR
jgi:GNAT superfamily N-acetyltransferase